MIDVVPQPHVSCRNVAKLLAKTIGARYCDVMNGNSGPGLGDVMIFVGGIVSNIEPKVQAYEKLFTSRRKVIYYVVCEGRLSWVPEHLKGQTVIAPSKFVKGCFEDVGLRVEAVIPHAVAGPFTERHKRVSESLLYISATGKGTNKWPEHTRILWPSITTNIPGSPDAAIVELYKNAGYYANLSDGEGFGLTVLEALAYGLPVITAKYPPITEFTDGDCAVYVPVQDVSFERTSMWQEVKHNLYTLHSYQEGIRVALERNYECMSVAAVKKAKEFSPDVYKRFLEFV